MARHTTRRTSKHLLRHCKTATDNDFWTTKLIDAEELKTRQADYCDTVPSDFKVIFYESMSGARMMDSPYALFIRLYHEPEFRDYHHVWSVRSFDLIPDDFEDDPRVTFVTRNTDAYQYFLALAGFVIGNSLLPDYFVRKPEQKYLNTWHGIAYKALGRTQSSPLGAAGSVYNLLQATHVLTPCPDMTETELSRFSLRGVYSGSMAEVGYPRQDLTLNLSKDDGEGIRDQLGLDPAKKTILYAPTWRGNKGSARFDAEQLEKDITSLMKLDANVIFQAHHIMLRHIKNVDYGNVIVPPSHIVTNELLGITDLLISDYSSIFFDFLATGRPIVHYLYDYGHYADERGLLLDKSELPGPIVATADELVATVNGLISDDYVPTKHYRSAQKKFCPHDDGNATSRTINWFIRDDASDVNLIETRERPSIIFWGGRLDNGKKTEEFLRSVGEAAERGDRDVTLLVARSVNSNKSAMDHIRQLGLSISVITRNDFEMVMTSAEAEARIRKGTTRHQTAEEPLSRWVRLKSLVSRSKEPIKTKDVLLDDMYHREYRRIFGDAQFDELVMFPGASQFWRRLAAHAVSDGKHHQEGQR
ncbi:CDP-glycerol glycerophosphotransferase family protein [Brevibacterium atlanticum]|uniref:CDP-glycerol glycerophosphotransferase family protein n=1 Tax=Brevibacterium atlanticum TaxID=2697563 RepID=UPI001422BC9A|nr:CDP-glycerol glycerophosphotransferase family protein [Brevibacterium atlanticum]